MKVINSQSLLSEEISWHWSVMEFLEQAPVSAIPFLLPENPSITAVNELHPFFHQEEVCHKEDLWNIQMSKAMIMKR